jgi:IclR family transcriptional regulator, KDG regulon repressor
VPPESAKRPAPGYRAPAVLHAVRLLEAFLDGPPEFGLSELGRRVGLSKSTVHRLTATLLEAGWLERDPATDRFRLGLRLFELGSLVAGQLEVRQCALPLMEELMDRVDETIHLAILEDDAMVYVAKVEGRHAIRLFSRVGQRGPVHATGVGKVLLAHAPPEVLERVLTDGLTRFTPRTIIEPAALRAELADVREQGYAVNVEESELGLASVAAPIRDHTGTVVAALSAAGPTQRLTSERLPGLIADVVDTAREVSRRMGHRAAATVAEPRPVPASRLAATRR